MLILILEERQLKDAQHKRTEECRLKVSQRKRTECQLMSKEEKGTHFCSIGYIPTSVVSVTLISESFVKFLAS